MNKILETELKVINYFIEETLKVECVNWRLKIYWSFKILTTLDSLL